MRVRLPQHDAVPQQLEQNVIVAEEDEAERERVVPALRAQQRVQLIQHHARLDPDQQVQDPQRLVEQELDNNNNNNNNNNNISSEDQPTEQPRFTKEVH